MKTLLEVLHLSDEFLKQKGIQQSRHQAEELIADALGIKRLHIYLEFDRPLTASELDNCRQRLARRAKGEPNQYIQGQVEFYHCTLIINQDVLIPRQETEILVDLIAKQLAAENLHNKSLWDLCCGSGCIGIALKKRFPDLQVFLSDISAEALKVAEKNAQLNGVQVEILEGDLLKPFAGKKAHYVVCNPPYISEAEFTTLANEVQKFEPKRALLSGKTGYEFYERLAKELPLFLEPDAKGWFEMGTGQGKTIQTLFERPPWKNCSVKQDWSGHDRFFFLEIE